MFEAAEIRAMLAAAPLPLKAMILLGINCGFGNTDVADIAFLRPPDSGGSGPEEPQRILTPQTWKN